MFARSLTMYQSRLPRYGRRAWREQSKLVYFGTARVLETFAPLSTPPPPQRQSTKSGELKRRRNIVTGKHLDQVGSRPTARGSQANRPDIYSWFAYLCRGRKPPSSPVFSRITCWSLVRELSRLETRIRTWVNGERHEVQDFKLCLRGARLCTRSQQHCGSSSGHYSTRKQAKSPGSETSMEEEGPWAPWTISSSVPGDATTWKATSLIKHWQD